MKHTYSLLCLGDSYTVGEGIALHQSFPYQLVQMLRSKGLAFHAPEIVAQTGWTTFELAEYILHSNLSEHYDFVTLLIGVNNQYRNLSVEDYKKDFEFLAHKTLHFANENAGHVFVLSIPDWSVTTFANGKNCNNIRKEIDCFNEVNKLISAQQQLQYLDITPLTREVATGPHLLAADGLHYTEDEYKKWAYMLAEKILTNLKMTG